jgi:hypothetical protein
MGAEIFPANPLAEVIPLHAHLVSRAESKTITQVHSGQSFALPLTEVLRLYNWEDPLMIHQVLSREPRLVQVLVDAASEVEGFFSDVVGMELEAVTDGGDEPGLLVTVVEKGKTRDAIEHLDQFVRGWAVGLDEDILTHLAFSARAE